MQEVITKHIKKEFPESEFPFQIIFAIDNNGKLTVQVKWMNDVSEKSIVQNMSTLLCGVSEGLFKEQLIRALRDAGVKNNALQTTKKILESWAVEVANQHQSINPCVSPRDVFVIGRG